MFFCTMTSVVYFTGMVFTRKPFVVYEIVIVFCRNIIMGFLFLVFAFQILNVSRLSIMEFTLIIDK